MFSPEVVIRHRGRSVVVLRKIGEAAMQNWFLIAVLSTAMFAISPSAVAQSTVATTITTSDPAAYSQQVADHVASEGVTPLRTILTQIYAIQVHIPSVGAQLPPEYDGQFTTMQTLIAGRHASFQRKLDDIVVGDALRSIYYYHSFGDNIWVFTRFDFQRVSQDRWALSGLTWGGAPSVVGIAPEPNYHSTESVSH